MGCCTEGSLCLQVQTQQLHCSLSAASQGSAPEQHLSSIKSSVKKPQMSARQMIANHGGLQKALTTLLLRPVCMTASTNPLPEDKCSS